MAQRVTNSMMVMNFNRNLNAANKQMMKYQSQLATNQRIVRLSDDPVGVIKTVSARARLADIDQFKRNISDAQAWMTQSETALVEINEILKRVRELAVQAASDALDAGGRAAIGYEIAQLRDQVITVANTTLGDKFIFGGYNVTKAPFEAELDADGKPTGEVFFNGEPMVYGGAGSLDDLNAAVDYEIGVSNVFKVGMEGVGVMGIGEESNIFFLLNQFYNELNDPASNHENLKEFIDRAQEMQDEVLSQLSEIGGRMNRLDMMQERYGQDTLNYTKMLSDVADLDQAEATMWFSMQEAVYRAALAVGGRVLPATLMDFLR